MLGTKDIGWCQPALAFKGDDVNLYRYVGNDPPNVVDPTGLKGEAGVATLRGSTVEGTLVEAMKRGDLETVRFILTQVAQGTAVVGSAYLLDQARQMASRPPTPALRPRKPDEIPVSPLGNAVLAGLGGLILSDRGNEKEAALALS